METITKEDYIRQCALAVDPIVTYSWYYYAFAIPVLKDENFDEVENLHLYTKADGIYAKIDGVGYRIKEYKQDEPLFRVEDPIKLEKGFLPSIKEPIETTVGRLILNAVTFENVYDNVSYINKSLADTDTYESAFVDRMIENDEPRRPNTITVNEYIDGMDHLGFFEALGDVLVTTTTTKTITKAPGIDEYRAKLLKEFGDKINTPVGLVEFENLVAAYDREYLKDDVAYDTVFARKTKTARMKMHGVFGTGTTFVDDPDTSSLILNSIEDGMDITPAGLVKYFNDARAASFYRGDKTALGGYTYELLQKSLAGMRISSEPCKTTRGEIKLMTDQEVNYAVGRYYKHANSWKLIRSKEEANSLRNTTIEMRSPLYCKAGGNDYCYACISVAYKDNPNGISNIAAMISASILGMFMKFMHAVKGELVTMELEDIVN